MKNSMICSVQYFQLQILLTSKSCWNNYNSITESISEVSSQSNKKMFILRSNIENKTWIFILHLIERMNDFMTHIYTNCTHKYTFKVTYATMIIQIFDLSTTSPTSPPPSSTTSVPAKSLQPQSEHGICPSSFCNGWHQIKNVLFFSFLCHSIADTSSF